mgnify:CR=1 FL=1
MKTKVLIIKHDTKAATELRQQLAKNKDICVCDIISDGGNAVSAIRAQNPNVILLDFLLPNLDGLEATKIIRELSATVPIIAQSAFAYEHDVKAAMEAGCNDFIAKPIAQSKLKEVINKWLTTE